MLGALIIIVLLVWFFIGGYLTRAYIEERKYQRYRKMFKGDD